MKKALMLASVAFMIEQFNMNNIKILQQLGYEVEVAANFTDGGTLDHNRLEEFKKELDEKKIKYIDIPFERSPFSVKNIKAYRLIKKLIKEENYELIHVHSPVGSVLGRLAARKTNAKVIYTAHGFHFFKGAPLKYWLMFYPIEKWLSKYTDILITINKEDYEIAKKKFKAKNIQLVHGIGVDKNRFDFEMSKEERKQLREKLKLKEDDFVMIYVAELSVRKNQEMLLNAMTKLIKQNKKIKLLLVGKDSLDGKLQKFCKENQLENNVQFLGYRKDIPQLLKISDLLVSTSKQEGLPVNIMEGLIAGLPVIVTDCRGNRDLITDGVNGYIVKDEQLLIKRILELVSKRKMDKLSTKEFEKEEIEKKMRDIYQMKK